MCLQGEMASEQLVASSPPRVTILDVFFSCVLNFPRLPSFLPRWESASRAFLSGLQGQPSQKLEKKTITWTWLLWLPVITCTHLFPNILFVTREQQER